MRLLESLALEWFGAKRQRSKGCVMQGKALYLQEDVEAAKRQKLRTTFPEKLLLM
jgi:hypothetical protein